MRVEKTVEAFGRQVKVRELTVGEIRTWLAALGTQETSIADVVDLALFEDATLADLRLMTDVSDDEIATAAPSELAALLTEARAVNAHFFGLRERLLRQVQGNPA
ncbi:MAG: hypothetical protein BWY57_01608 [Betaproteobacteria bacterium ADurb.Bin341]|nr:MAG: hypothetical protein BWY57_01608 [Betaproteobacteria bacterium ADurb.Bin341]